MSEVRCILEELENGTLESADRLLPAVYGELRTLATAKFANEKVAIALFLLVYSVRIQKRGVLN